jgi:hypothetical protein
MYRLRLALTFGLAAIICGIIFTSKSTPPTSSQTPRQAIKLTYIDTPTDSTHKVSLPGDPFSVGQLIGGQFNVESCNGGLKVFTDRDWQDGRPVLNDTFDDSDIKGADLGTSFDGVLNGKRVLFFLPGDINNLNADNSMAVSHSGSPDHFALRFLKETRGPNKGTTFLFGKGNHVPFKMGPDNNPQAGVSIDGANYVVFKTGHEINGDASGEYSILTHFDDTNLHRMWDVAPSAINLLPRIISSNDSGGHFVQVALVHHGDYVYMFGTGFYRKSSIYLARIHSKSDEPFPTNNFWTGLEPTQYLRSFLISGGTVSPDWSESESDAMPLVDDQYVSVHGVDVNVCANPTIECSPPRRCGQSSSHACGPSVGNFSVQFEASLGLWIMTFDGGRQKDCQGDPDHIHGIYLSYAKDPWGPWSTPQNIFNPATDGGFGNFIYNPDDPCNSFATPLTIGGPAGPALNPKESCNTRGDAYGPFMIKRFNSVDPSGTTLSIYYTVSTFNPYTIVLMHSDFTIGY